MWRRLSLAGKCLVLFGAGVVLVVLAALWVGWVRMAALVDSGQFELSRAMVEAWERMGPGPSPAEEFPSLNVGAQLSEERGGILVSRIPAPQARQLARSDAFLQKALDTFARETSRSDLQAASWSGTTREYRYARVVRDSRSGEIRGLVVLDRHSVEATRLVITNTIYLLIAGTMVLGLALLIFYIITQKLILGPVRQLRDAAERVREGNLAVRSDLKTGDEFEELSDTINLMLTDLQTSQDRLRAINSALDVQVHELAETNAALFQAAKVKGEFLANVSHELRTPLNSIIGFAELLMEQAKIESEKPDAPPTVAKRVRYLDNLLRAGRALLDLINSLLEMARIEAGRVELHIERMSLRDVCEGLLGLIAPQADKKGVQLSLEVPDDVPVIATDPKKFRQVIFNFLSNAVKFSESEERTGRRPLVILRAERLVASGEGGDDRVRVSVIDNGPGIPKEEQDRVFEKFYQLDGGHTREHTGTGLGLAISRELAGILQSEIQLVSEVGRGSMFSLILPRELHQQPAAESAMEARLRSSLAAGREWN